MLNIRYALFLVLCFFFLSLPGIAQEKARPQSGDGINSFLRRHNRTSQAHHAEFIELNKKKLGKNNSLLLHIEYTLPPLNSSGASTATASAAPKATTGKRMKEPLFGKKYENYTVKSQALSGAHYFLVSGHGGVDCGAVTRIEGRELHEDEYAYDIVLRLARNLLEHGATVDIIIQDKNDGIRDERYLKNSQTETCMGARIPAKQLPRLQQRAAKINELSRKSKATYKRAIFVHLDSRSHQQQLDVYFFYQNNNQRSKQFASTVRNTFEAQYKKHQPKRGFSGTISTRNLYVLSHTEVPSIFAELANMQNSFDRRRYLEVDNRQAMANWLYRGFLQDYENNKKRSKN